MDDQRLDLLNCMRLNIKIQQLSKSGQAKGFMIKSKLAAAVQGTRHPTFDCDWAWRQIREMWPEEIAPTCVSQTESIRNESTTYTKVNDWFTCN